MKKLVLGILAHVDSGKTTLSEGILYYTGKIRNMGRVDKKNTFFDTHMLERQRGITIFSKQAHIKFEDMEITLLDTPGHIDFSSETERVLQVLDYAVLIVNGAEGVQSHTETLWKLLRIYKIPVFIFINKMDFSDFSHEEIMSDIKKRLNPQCVDFSEDNFYEDTALCDESLMAEYLENDVISDENISQKIKGRVIFPCVMGSALKMQGVDRLIEIIKKYTVTPVYSEKFSARVFKISEDENGNRLTHMKITGGFLKVKSVINNEKINQIRIYSGTKYRLADIAGSGMICTVTGLENTYSGQGLGDEADSDIPRLEPILSYKAKFPPECDIHKALKNLKKIEEESPELHIEWNERFKEINIHLMGEIQLETLKSIVHERFGLEIEFTEGRIAYKETIKSKSEGVGHYEPLKHYAEVHLLLEPLKTGSGLHFCSDCREDMLDRNYQRLIMTHLKEKQHTGVLTGSPITDMKITLVSGKAHVKHTEGGDFRQAVYRAVRNGLRKAESVILEPYYAFTIEVPVEYTGKALSDMQFRDAEFSSPETFENKSVIKGFVPAETVQDYQKELSSYTAGKGRFTYIHDSYRPARNPEKIIAESGYKCDEDIENNADSIFCSHGAGFVVKWDEVEKYMHIESCLKTPVNPESYNIHETVSKSFNHNTFEEDKELMQIFERTYGKINRDERSALYTVHESDEVKKPQKAYEPKKGDYLLVDGYNIIFSWDELKKQAAENLDLARNTLINKLCNYQGFKKCRVILVFDAYKVKGNKGSCEHINNIDVIYTKEAETADSYIERVSHELGRDFRVRVATSDNLEQLIILGNGAYRISALEFYQEMKNTELEIMEYAKKFRHKKSGGH